MNVNKMWQSPHERTRKDKSQFSLQDGKDQAEKLRNWMENNQEAFEFMLNFMQSEKHVKYPRSDCFGAVSAHLLTKDSQFKVNNNHFPGIARYMVLVDPSLESKLKMRDSVLDIIGLYPISYLKGKVKC